MRSRRWNCYRLRLIWHEMRQKQTTCDDSGLSISFESCRTWTEAAEIPSNSVQLLLFAVLHFIVALTCYSLVPTATTAHFSTKQQTIILIAHFFVFSTFNFCGFCCYNNVAIKRKASSRIFCCTTAELYRHRLMPFCIVERKLKCQNGFLL